MVELGFLEPPLPGQQELFDLVGERVAAALERMFHKAPVPQSKPAEQGKNGENGHAEQDRIRSGRTATAEAVRGRTLSPPSER